MLAFLKKYFLSILSAVLFVGILVFSIIAVRNLDIKNLTGIFKALSGWDRLSILVVGFIAFIADCFYEPYTLKMMGIPMPLHRQFVLSMSAQGVSNFVNIAGLSGTKIRADFLRPYEPDMAKVMHFSLITLFGDTLGLAFLAFPSLLVLGPALPPFYWLLSLSLLYIPAYYFAPQLEKTIFKKWALPVVGFPNKDKTAIFGLSLIDWFAASTFFAWLVNIVEPNTPYIPMMAIFVLSSLVGVVSFIPGGLGSFEVSAAVLAKNMGVSEESIIIALVLFRIGYDILPWLLGLGLYLNELIRQKTAQLAHIEDLVSKILSCILLLFGLGIFYVNFIIKGSLFRQYQAELLTTWFLLDVTCIILILISSRAVLTRSRMSWWGGLISCLLSGFMLHSENNQFISVAVPIVIFLSFLRFTKIFNKSLKIRPTRTLLRAWLTFFVAFLFAVLLAHIMDFSWMVFFVMGLASFTLALAYSWIWPYYQPIHFRAPSLSDLREFQAFIASYPTNEFTQLYFMQDKMAFYNSTRTVCIMYRPERRYLIVLGDPFGKKEDFASAVEEFLLYGKRHGMIVSFYQVTDQYLSLYIDAGFDLQKIGESALVLLKDFTYEGRPFKNIRKVHKALDKGEFVFEMLDPPFSKEVMDRLVEISNVWLKGRKEMSFSMGHFDRAYLSYAPIAVLKDPTGKIVAFANMNPMPQTPYVTMDMMRFDDTCPEGIMEVLFLGLIDWAKDQGYEGFLMGHAPMSSVGEAVYAGLKDKILHFFFENANRYYSFKGLRAYKDKFHPVWYSTYLAYRRNTDLEGVLRSLLRLIYPSPAAFPTMTSTRRTWHHFFRKLRPW